MSYKLRNLITLDSIAGNKMINKALLRQVQGAAKNAQGVHREKLRQVMEQAITEGFRQMKKDWGSATTAERLLAELHKNTELCKVIAQLGIDDSKASRIAETIV
jgi:hypothetical protein